MDADESPGGASEAPGAISVALEKTLEVAGPLLREEDAAFVSTLRLMANQLDRQFSPNILKSYREGLKQLDVLMARRRAEALISGQWMRGKVEG